MAHATSHTTYSDGTPCPFCRSNENLAVHFATFGATFVQAQVWCRLCGVHGPQATFQVDGDGLMMVNKHPVAAVAGKKLDHGHVPTRNELWDKAVELWEKMTRNKNTGAV